VHERCLLQLVSVDRNGVAEIAALEVVGAYRRDSVRNACVPI
jgi:hypothetical protein